MFFYKKLVVLFALSVVSSVSSMDPPQNPLKESHADVQKKKEHYNKKHLKPFVHNPDFHHVYNSSTYKIPKTAEHHGDIYVIFNPPQNFHENYTKQNFNENYSNSQNNTKIKNPNKTPYHWSHPLLSVFASILAILLL